MKSERNFNFYLFVIRKELKYFSATTKKVIDPTKRNALIMGRKTYMGVPESKRPLPERLNIVLSRDPNPTDYPESVIVCKSFDEALSKIAEPESGIENVWIVGGSSVYNEAMNSAQCHRVYFTEVKGDFECDTFFPAIPDVFKLVPNDSHMPTEIQEEDGIKYQYKVYERIN